LQQLILQNVTKFSDDHWSRIVGAFVELFDKTTAYELFTAAAPLTSAKTPTSEAKTNGDSATNDTASAHSIETATDNDQSSTTNGASHATEDGDPGESPAQAEALQGSTPTA
jgi:brefeldin A-inhibited guanine nucleotide-exchange protein